jgi:hypothetical protein
MRALAIVAIAMSWAISATAHAAPGKRAVTTTEIQQTQGRTLLDLDGDGTFELLGGLDVTSYFISCDTRLDEFNDVIRVLRTALEFDMSALLPRKQQHKIRSITLVVEVAGSRNLNQQNPDGSFAPATWTLNGYAGDGVVGPGDALYVNPIAVDIAAPPASVVEIDVTEFVKTLLAARSDIAGFMLQIPGDYVRNNFQDSQIYADSPELNRIGPRLVIVQSGREMDSD